MIAKPIALVTGAGSGVGKAIATALAAQGMSVALIGRTVTKLEHVQQLIVETGGSAAVFPCDVADLEAVAALQADVTAALGTVQILVNNAGLHNEFLPIAQTTPERWQQTWNVNTLGPYLTCRHFMDGMIQAGWGRIINVSSLAALGQPHGVAAVYQASKVALNFFTRQLAEELQDTGVTANAIHPGEVQTEMWQHIKNDAHQRGETGAGGRKWSQIVEDSGGDPPEKAAALVLDLISPRGDSINGQFLLIEDGLSGRPGGIDAGLTDF